MDNLLGCMGLEHGWASRMLKDGRHWEHNKDCGWGQVLVNGLRVRVRLDEARLTELLRSATDAATTAGLLACLGDLATISFDPHLSGLACAHRPCSPAHYPNSEAGIMREFTLSLMSINSEKHS